MFGLDVGQATPVAEAKIWSPFAAVNVSFSVVVNPPQSEAPVGVALATNAVFPRWSKYPVAVPVMVVGVVDVIAKVPDRLPLKGVAWEAKTTGKVLSNTRADMIIGASIFILI